ncbi:PD-(D/E)XK nuclease family transposase [Sulfurovum sp. bin170]|uniref:Rpn family recombination-promoting nuclease/putative transposase n=1 Tax=Sulfurovum sp. bin170 TaxID=2695268 RepID=UPI0013DF4B6C|nr:Rpn family recombination-promoting nuclease/putative transposase [Sulfurovum sp. bin170]NEW60327.1 PD-(D/E)XK nuclease family transposase [Sulfurovum sp. bin170]
MCMMIKDKYIDPFTDFGFKHIFGTEENKRFLISFLNDLLELEDKIVDITYRNLEKLGLNIIDRKAIFDVYCTDEKSNNFIVELQRSPQRYFKDRSVYYTSFPIQEQSKKGDWDYRLTPIYFIGILEFAFDDMRLKKSKDDNRYITKVQLFDCDKREVFYDKLTYYYIEMPKFRKKEEELANHLDYWLYYLNNLSTTTKIPEILKKDELLEDAFGVAEFLALDKDEQFTYQQDLKARWDNKACLDFAKEMALEEGEEIGKKKGEEIGQREAKMKIARELLDVLDIETISLKTGLSIKEIEDMKI